MTDPQPEVAEPRSMLWFAWDLPNRISLAGLACALLGIHFAVTGRFEAAMIGLVWAVAFDWLDGRVARRMPDRSAEQREFGMQLDSLIDVVSFGVAPALLLLSAGGYGAWLLPGAFVVFAASVVRLAYFNVFGLVQGETYRGLALDNNMLLLVALFAFRPLMSQLVFAIVLYVVLMGLSALNLAPIRTPKLGGRWYLAVIAYAVVVSGWYGWQIVLEAA